MTYTVAALAAFVLAALPAYAQQRDPSEVVTRSVSTSVGRAVLVRTYALWRSDCTSRGAPVVMIDPQPQHGTVSVQPGTATVREYLVNGANCVGRQVLGTSVSYQPAPGFRRVDQFGMTANMAQTIHDLAVVDVR